MLDSLEKFGLLVDCNIVINKFLFLMKNAFVIKFY